MVVDLVDWPNNPNVSISSTSREVQRTLPQQPLAHWEVFPLVQLPEKFKILLTIKQ